MYGKTGKSVPDTKILLWPPNVKSHHRDSARSPSQRQVHTLHQTHLTKGRRTPGQRSLRAWQATERTKADFEKFWCPTEEIRKDYKIAWEYKNNNGSQNSVRKTAFPLSPPACLLEEFLWKGFGLLVFFFLAGPMSQTEIIWNRLLLFLFPNKSPGSGSISPKSSQVAHG